MIKTINKHIKNINPFLNKNHSVEQKTKKLEIKRLESFKKKLEKNPYLIL